MTSGDREAMGCLVAAVVIGVYGPLFVEMVVQSIMGASVLF